MWLDFSATKWWTCWLHLCAINLHPVLNFWILMCVLTLCYQASFSLAVQPVGLNCGFVLLKWFCLWYSKARMSWMFEMQNWLVVWQKLRTVLMHLTYFYLHCSSCLYATKIKHSWMFTDIIQRFAVNDAYPVQEWFVLWKNNIRLLYLYCLYTVVFVFKMCLSQYIANPW